MLRLWKNSYAKSAVVLLGTSAVLSTVVHTGVIAAWIWATLPAPGLPANSVSNRVYYIPPPDRSVGNRPVREAVRYVDLAATGVGQGDGDGQRKAGNAHPITGDERVGHAATDSVVAPPPAAPESAVGTQDSVFSILEVDSAVTRSANSAAPAYPLNLLAAHVMGYVNARYVVDTTGFAVPESFQVLRATNPEFVAAVRDALPNMRFKPAKVGAMKVRQLVEQQFSFKIDTTILAATTKTAAGTPPRRPR